MKKELLENLIADFEGGKKYFQTYNSLAIFSTWTDILEEAITDEGQRSRVYNNLYLRLPQLNEEQRKLYESITPLSREENEVIWMAEIIGHIYAMGNIIKANSDQLVLELMDNIITFLKKQRDLN